MSHLIDLDVAILHAVDLTIRLRLRVEQTFFDWTDCCSILDHTCDHTLDKFGFKFSIRGVMSIRRVMVPGVPCLDRINWGRERGIARSLQNGVF